MEKNTEYQLPPIFGFSNISWILAYYGYLNEWKMILWSISTQTKSIWDDNQRAFMNFGNKLKRAFYIKDYSQNTFKMLCKNHTLFSDIYIDLKIVTSFLIDIYFKIQNDQEILWHRSKDPYFYLLYINHADKSSEILPALNWKMHKKEFKKFTWFQKRNIYLYINRNLF